MNQKLVTGGNDFAGVAQASLADRSSAGLHRTIFIGLALVLALAPFFVYPVFLIKVLCFVLFASAFNLLLGFGGLMSFGHAAYFGMGGYLCAHSMKVWGFSPELGILTGTAVATLLGAAFGAVAVRRQGIYFAMVTLALAQLVYFVCLQSEFTGGEDGIQSVPRGSLFGLIDLHDDLNLYYLVAVLAFAGLLLIYRVIHSPFGYVCKAIRENEPRAISLGYRANQYKLVVFILSAGLAGLAGSMKAIAFQIAALSDVHWSMSGEPVLMTLIGGIGTIFGPLVGAVIIVSMQNFLAHLGEWVTVVQGSIFVVCVLVFREGIVGVLSTRLGRKL